MGKRLNRDDILKRVNGVLPPQRQLTMKSWQRALSIARHNKLAPVKTLDRLGKSKR